MNEEVVQEKTSRDGCSSREAIISNATRAGGHKQDMRPKTTNARTGSKKLPSGLLGVSRVLESLTIVLASNLSTFVGH